MKNGRFIHWLWLTLLLIMPMSAFATDYFEEEYTSMCFTVTPNGPGCVHLKIMYLDQGTGQNAYLEKNSDYPNGPWVYMTVDGSSDRRYIVACYTTNDDSDDSDVGNVTMRFSANGEDASKYTSNGVLILTNAYSGEPVEMSTSNKDYELKKPKGDARCFVEFDWYYPVELAGKKVSFYINGDVAWGDDLSDRELTGSPMSCTDKPDLYISDPIFIPTGADQGYNRLVVSNTTGAQLKIKNVTELVSTTGQQDVDITADCKSSSDGMSLLIPAVNYSRRLKVEAQVPYSEKIYYDMPAKVVQLAAFHNPKDFNLKTVSGKQGHTKLSWSVPYADQEDVLPSDLIMVERQLYNNNSGTSDIWQTLNQLVLEPGKTSYEYTDSTQGSYGTADFNSVRYRIYRAAVGQNEKYACVSEMPNRTRDVLPCLVSVAGSSLREGKVTVEALLEIASLGQTSGFLPKNWNVTLRRTATYTKKGITTNTVKDIDLTKYITEDNASKKRMRYVDEAFSPCTRYSYKLIFNPNDPAGVMKNGQETEVNFGWASNGRKVTDIEPVVDDSKVGNFTASNDTQQDRIHLQWSLDTERMNTIKVEKYAGSWVEVPIDPNMSYFDDYGVEAGHPVQYRLTMEYECTDGVKSLSVDATGQRRASGKIGGFVTFSDGTGLSDVDVQLLQDETVVETVKTDATGAYLFPDVMYSNKAYTIRINAPGVTDFDRVQMSVYLNKDAVNHFNQNFVSNGSFDVDGYVYFEQTTVPVYGATFMVDGQPVVDKSGKPIISDNDGHFAFKVVKGARRLEVQKEGHTFMFNGLYADNSGKAIEMTENRIGIFFWDQTKVRTIGRVVGGMDQGGKPLGFGLSQNNLGDELRIVLELEGNQRAWLVKDQQNEALTVRYDTLVHEQTVNKLTNAITTERHRIVIKPNTETGEYIADLLPTRYKVVEVSAQGYPSLFQKGKVAEVIDLSDSLTTKSIVNDGKEVNYRAIYNRVFRIEPSVDIVEVNTKTGEALPYVGDANYTEPGATGGSITVPLYESATKTYTFGYPVLRTGQHNFRIRATENYYYNGNQAGICDSVPVRGGKVRVYDDFAIVQHDTLCYLNENSGTADISVNVANTVYDVSGTNALRHIDVTLEHDGQFIDGRSLQAFVMGYQKISDDVMSADGIIEIVDVLRDPPGSKSFSWIDSETTYQARFNFAIGANLSLAIGLKNGSGTDLMSGAFTGSPAGTWMGTQTSASTNWEISPKEIPLVGFELTHTGSVNFQLNQRIQTSDDPAHVGDDADVYCGYELVASSNAVRNVRAINESTYRMLQEMGLFAEEDGACHLIMEGRSTQGQPYYLISDYNYQVGPKIKSNFAYTQDYILHTLLPKLRTMRNSYIYKGTREQAQAHATKTRRNVFFSLRSEDDPRYGQDNLDEHFDYISIDRYDEFRDQLNYEVIPPMYVDVLGLRKQMAYDAEVTDSIRIINRKIAQWEYVIARNEMEKLAAFEAIDSKQSERGDMEFDAGSPYDVADESFYVENHSISGGTMVNHSEIFSSSDDMDYSIPILGWDVTKWDEEQGMEYFNKIVSGGLSIAEDRANSQMGNLDWEKKWGSDPSVSVSYTTKNSQGKDVTHTRTLSGDALENMDKLQNLMKTMDGAKDVTVKTGGTYTKLTLEPNIGFTYESANDEQEDTKTYRGYQLETDGDSHLSIDVYHDVQTVASGINVFGVTSGERTLSKGNYLFRTVGGATKCPYEGGSVTQIFAPGTPLSAATAQVERPRISVEKHIISNVPYGETAKFNLVLSNEGIIREEGSFDLVLLDHTNQQGASLIIDGASLGNGRSLVVPFGTGTVKVLEVGQGLADDYENIRLALRSQCDPSVADTVSLSVHFVPSASPINIITPQNQWVLNTNSAQDEQGRYYMPMSINGFDVNFRNFDHVELQYKQTTEPESRWTNLCSYYNTDSLYAIGSGTKAMLSGSTITHAFYGDSDPVELRYDIRAVTYSRLGNDFVTRTSPILSGIKDTRRPQLFGSPQPANGILGVSDVLKLVFSENINANRLLATNNFRVTGTPNNTTDISTSTSIMLNGKDDSYLESEAERNFDGESFTIDMMVKPAEKDEFMSLFTHRAVNGNSLVFSINGKTHELRAEFTNGTTGEKTVNQSKPISDVNWNMFQRVMMIFDNKENRTHFYVNSACVDNNDDWQPLYWDYAGNGRMVFGRGYQGNLLETRVWTKALTLDEINETGNKSLYGHEVNLCAYYPMNEGMGNSIEDKAQGATLLAHSTAWTTLSGKAIRLGSESTDARLTIKPFKQINRGKSYTLTFWMNADTNNKGKNVGLLTPGLATKEFYLKQGVGYTTLYMEDGHIAVRRGYYDAKMRSERSYNDGQWHHVALSVDRANNEAVLYVDGEVAAREAADETGHWNDEVVNLGRYYYYSWTQHKVIESDRLQGYLDEITLWNSPLTENVIRQKMNEKLDGSEIGLLAYMPFSEDIQQASGGAAQQEFTDKYFFSQWDPETQEYISNSESAYTNQRATYEPSNTVCAPVKEKAKETSLRFNFITKDNELIIELAEPAKSIERTTVNITAMGIEDMNGNEMEQPVIWSAFINRNMLRWAESKRHIEIDDYQENDYTFEMELNNHSGFPRTYTIEGLPEWMTIEEGTEGRLEPTESTTLHITISKDINIGTYDDVIYLKNDEGLVDPLSLTIRKFGHAPEWGLNKTTLSNMQLCAEIRMGGQAVTDKENIIVVFDDDENCMGKGNVTTDQRGRSLLYLTIYGEEPGARLHFRMWNAQSGIIYALTSDSVVTYTQDGIVGSYDNPVRMNTSLNITRELALEPIWTWVSLNVVSDYASNLNQLLRRGQWKQGDQLKDLEEQTFFSYDNGKWLYNGPTDTDILRTDRMYCIKSQEGQILYIDGRPLMDTDDRTITLHHDWNYIGYTPLVNLPVNEALADFYSKASDGDIIKSQDEFATFSSKGGGWHGNLKYMKPGEGYMLYHQITSQRPDSTVTFTYPFKSTTGITGIKAESASRRLPSLFQNNNPTTMTMIVQADGVDVQDGDRLLAYANGELCGVAEVTEDGIFFLSVGGEKQQQLMFTIERDGQLIGTATHDGIVYQANLREGTTSVPRLLHFNETKTFENGIYYTLTGIRYGSERPTTKSIYIYNNQKIWIK